jgi:hypothetical protein
VTKRVKREFVWDNELQARIGARRTRYNFLCKKVGQALIDGELPADPLRPALQMRFTSNPLRLGEKNRSYTAQSNTFGSEVTVQKVLQLLSVTREALLSLSGTLQIVSFVNDFTKKLLAKYVIVELNTMFMLFVKLAQLDRSYGAAEHLELLTQVKALENAYAFRDVRSKVGAHLDADLDLSEYVKYWAAITSDSVDAYLRTLEDHLVKVMQSRYQWEYRTLILMPERDVPGTMEVAANPNREYVPYDGLDL